MIIGAHSILYSERPEADRAFLRDLLRLPNVDVGDGRLMFGLPPAEVAVTLPGGGVLGVYQARHARPRSMTVRRKQAAREPRERKGAARR